MNQTGKPAVLILCKYEWCKTTGPPKKLVYFDDL